MQNLTAPYGRIQMNVLKQNDLSPRQKLVYAIISAKKGESSVAKLSNEMIADALGITERYVTATITKLIDLGLLEKLKTGQYNTKTRSRQHGMVELNMLITENLSVYAKYLYLIYCTAANGLDANTWGKEGACSQFHWGSNSYQDAHKELVDKKILFTIKRSKGNGLQTSNLNYIVRVEEFETVIPDSWLPKPAFDLDEWCDANLEKELAVLGKRNSEYNLEGTERTSEKDESVPRTVTINSNLNNSSPISNLEKTNENFKNSSIESPKIELKIELLEEVIERKLKTPEEARKAIDTLNDNGFEGIAKSALTDEMLGKAFKAFENFKDAVESYGQDTFGYALNIDDLNRFCSSDLSKGYSEDSINYHIWRVAELGFEKLKKPYLGFSYVIKTNSGVKQPQF